MRYIKQIKARATEIIYDYNNILVCEIIHENSFLGFRLLENGNEGDHLKRIESQNTRSELENKIIEINNNEPELNNAQIAKKLGTYDMKVARALKKHKEESMVNHKSNTSNTLL